MKLFLSLWGPLEKFTIRRFSLRIVREMSIKLESKVRTGVRARYVLQTKVSIVARHNAIIIIMPDRYAIFVVSHGVCHYKDGGTKAHGMPCGVA